jgi:ring-1,2-phenylacetyl-CoA epoxidase subunit PaaE
MTPTTRLLRVAQIIDEVPEVKTFVFQPVDTLPFKYQAGQFLTLLFDDHGQEVRRSFSFSSTPGVDELPAITIKRVPNGLVTRRLLDYTKVGDVLPMLEPAGRFVINENATQSRHVFLIAAGSGITPIFSLLKQLLHQEPHTHITLIYSNKSVESTIFYEQIKTLHRDYSDRLNVVFLWGNVKNLRWARLNNTLLEELVRQHLPTTARENALFYTCGPFHFMLMVQITLLTMGFDKDQIHREFYVIEAKSPTPKLYPPQPVQFSFKGSTQTVEVTNNQTILEAGLKAGLSLPYTCRAGRCGACAALCVQGRAEMEYNEVLTDEEVSLGQVLTCMAHPLTDNVSIQW